MKTHRFTAGVSFLAVICLGVQWLSGQLILPWEKEGAPNPPIKAPVKEPLLESDTIPPPPAAEEEMEGAACDTPVEAIYLAWADQIFAKTKGAVRIGSPQKSAKSISVSVTLNDASTTVVFVEKSNDGHRARVIVGPKDSEGEYFGAEKKANGWALASWSKGFRPNGGNQQQQPQKTGTITLTWKDLNSRRLDRSDLLGLSKAELRLWRNEIYARYGQIFSNEELQAHFNRQDWYRPRFKEIDESKFPAVLKHNIEMIRSVEKE
jgi:hypothetical protein